MTQDKIIELHSGLETAFINSTNTSSLAYRPQFVSNNYKEGKKVLSSIESELLRCDKFQISVAFITMGGITPLLQTLKELETKGIPGEILTTNYLNFSEPRALEKLNSLSNITLKMYDVEMADEGFHTKGYIFKKEEIYRIIVGSSNMTSAALTSNREWNTKVISTEQGEMAKEIVAEFNELWNSKYALSFDEFYENYKESYKIIKHQRQIAREEEITSVEKYKLQPNSMQVGFITNLRKIIEAGEDRALLISATGTGKTYASAFAMRELGFKNVLFLVHREQILKQARRSYKNVLEKSVTTGLLSGNYKETEADYIFSTVQTMSKDYILSELAEDRFDCIIIDETHKAGAESYHKIINHFKPKLLLGMTASPERTDGFDIYKLFDNNIAYEIRLQQALEEDLLCPFHYFGMTDLEVNGAQIDDNTEFRYLVSKERVEHVIAQAEYFGHSGNRVKGLIFCSRNEEAKELSDEFNKRGYNTVALSGANTQEERENAVECLEMDCDVDENGRPLNDKALDYIFTVDIFNEGVDIPQVNQVIMLRPTQSAIIFVQQLGRGLRKADDKEYVVILDFIGNYQNNFLIPIALSGDRTYNKDNIRRYVREGSRVIPGSSTVHFDEITKKRIFQSIDKMTTKKKMLTDKYTQLKYKLGRIPTVLDFYELGEVDPMLFINYAKTYDNFLRMVDNEYQVRFTQNEEKTLEFVSSLIIDGKRPHELLMLRALIADGAYSESKIKTELETLGDTYRAADYKSAASLLNKEFVSGNDVNKYMDVEFADFRNTTSDMISRTLSFAEKLRKKEFLDEINNLIKYGLRRYNDMFKNHDENNLVLYQKYSRKDVCRLLNWGKDESSTMYGYRIKHNTCPIFVTYEKKDDISESTKYEDELLTPQLFNWYTRSGVSIDSVESQEIIKSKQSGLKICLFVKKSDGEGTDFYYMGQVSPDSWKQTTILNNKGKQLPIMNFVLRLEHSVREDIYEYFTK